MLWLLLDLDELPMLARRLRLFSLNRFNLVDFRDRDHGDGSMISLRTQIEQHLRCAGLAVDGGAIRVLCMPRVLGTVFNPLSVFFCYRADGRLQAMLYEVHNTFGERHSYLIPVADADAQPVLRQSCAKAFHVSPFMDMAMTYHFRITPPAERAVVAIEGSDAEGRLISAAYVGTRHELDRRQSATRLPGPAIARRAGAWRDPLGGAETLAQGRASAQQTAATGGTGQRGARWTRRGVRP